MNLRRLRAMWISDFMNILVRPTPTPFSGDPAQAQRFIDEFEQLVRRNRRNLLVVQPELRVELALAFIDEDPTTTAWKRTIRRGNPAELADESIWDEFFDSFCTAWIDETPMPATQAPSLPVNAVKLDFVPSTIDPAPVSSPLSTTLPTPVGEPLASVPATTGPPIPRPVNILEPTVTPSTINSDSPPPRPPRSPRRPVSPRITHPPVSAVEVNSAQTTRFASSLPPVTETEETLAISALVPPARATLDPLTPTAPPTSDKTLVPCAVPAPNPPDVFTLPRIQKRKRHDSLCPEVNLPRECSPAPTLQNVPAAPRKGKRRRFDDSRLDDTRTRKHAFAPRRKAPVPTTSAPSFPVPYAPPLHRPRPAPGDPARATSHSMERNIVVEDDNVPRRGVKTLDDSVFA
ncbi:hypothetical protein EDB86DRAFT_2390278 [Lactarius hatsudake]|nr:hypothetical protein EDB86DRAFT_2390278 [Lactarius hatsudake]